MIKFIFINKMGICEKVMKACSDMCVSMVFNILPFTILNGWMFQLKQRTLRNYTEFSFRSFL
jgi:hypothetical protein